jgi:hypothetical protein
MTDWRKGQGARDARIRAGAKFAKGKIVEARDATALLESVIRPGDRVCLEGDNQKQADLLAGALAAVDVGKVHATTQRSPSSILMTPTYWAGSARRWTPWPRRRGGWAPCVSSAWR